MTLRVGDSAAVTDTGRLRHANEDAHYASAPLFGVADGMGGAQAGEVASGIAVETLAAGLDESLAPEQRLAKVVRDANSEIHRRSVADAELHGMGTTMTVLLMGEDEVTIAHVGDSRAYRLRDGELDRLTRDHSLVGEMVRRGALTDEEAEQHPQRSILTRALGPDATIEVDVHTHSARDGDIYLLCSDGLTTMVSDDTIREVAGGPGSMQQKARELVRRANANGGADNITVVALQLTGAGMSSPAPADPGSETLVDAPAVAGPGSAGTPPQTDDDAPATARQAASRPTAFGPDAPVSVRERARQRNRRSRRVVTVVLVSTVLAIAAAGAALGALQVYFLGIDEQGMLTVYRGLPYEGPMSLNLYTVEYTSTEPATKLTPAERARLLDHHLRNRADALDLIRQVEQGRVAVDGETQ